MFESLLESILSRIIGRYVEGISKDQMKVGIFNGKVEINNLKIKKSVVKEFQLPFTLSFGMIKNIKLKIPWTSIQSSPVEVFLEGLYLIISPSDRDSWQTIQNDYILNKHQQVIKFAQNLRDTIKEKLKLQNGNKEKGYFAKVVQTIIDNLQIDIRNIHIRVESQMEPIEQSSLGMTLDSLKVFTCDENMNPTFYDSSKSKKGVVYKKLDIQNFYVYFNDEEKDFLSKRSHNEEEYQTNMEELIYREANHQSELIKKQNYLLNFSTIGKMIQHKLSQKVIDDLIPEYQIEISLNSSNFSISEGQIEKLQKIANLATDYTIFFKQQQKKYEFYHLRPVKQISEAESPEEKKELQKEWLQYALTYAAFKNEKHKQQWVLYTPEMQRKAQEQFMLIYNLLESQQEQNFSQLSEIDQRNYENILMKTDITTIQKWVESKIKKEEIEKKFKEEKGKKQGYFGGWFSKTEDLNENEKEKIENFIGDIFEEQQNENLVIPDHYPNLSLKFIQKKFKIRLSRKNQIEDKREFVESATKNLILNILMKKKGMKVEANLKSFKINYVRQNFEGEVQRSKQIVYCDNQDLQKQDLLKVVYEDQPSGELDKKITAQMKSLNIVYDKEMIECTKQIFTLEEVNQTITDHIKNRANQQIRQAKDIGENAFKNFMHDQPKILVEIKMDTPNIMLPVSQELHAECWIFHPGNLYIKGDTFSSTQSDNQQDKMYDIYQISLENIKMMYQEKSTENQGIKLLQADKNLYKIFQDFNINVDVQLLKKLFVDLNCKDAKTLVKAELNELNMNFTPQVLHKLQNITNVFIEDNNNQLVKEKAKIFKKAEEKGFVSIKEKKIQNLYFVVLYKNYLYFYRDPIHDTKEFLKIHLEQLTIIYKNGLQEIDLAMKDKSRQFCMIFKQEDNYQLWKKDLVRCVDQINQRKMIFEEEEDTYLERQTMVSLSEANQADQEIEELKLNFIFKNLMININDESTFYQLCSRNLLLNMIQTNQKIKVNLELQNFNLLYQKENVKDYIICSNISKSNLNKIKGINYKQEQDKLIIISYEQPIKKGVQRAEISFGSLFLDVHPYQIQDLLKIVMNDNEKEQTEQQNLSLGKGEELNEKILENLDFSESKRETSEEVENTMEIVLEIQAINLLFFNDVCQIPLSNIIVKKSKINVDMAEGKMEVDAYLNDLEMYDLTNYPLTLTKVNFESIKPRNIFGKHIKDDHQTMIYFKFQSFDPQFFNIQEDFKANKLRCKIQNIFLTYFMEIINRNINFINEQFMPAVKPDFKQPKINKEQNYSYLERRKAYVNIMRPFWIDMDISISNTQCILEINEESRLVAYLMDLQINNNRYLNKERLLIFQEENQKHSIQGIWSDTYSIQISDLNCKIIKKETETKLTSGLNMKLDVDMGQYEIDYRILFNSKLICNYKEQHLKTPLKDNTHDVINQQDMYYDNAMLIDIKMDPFIVIMGNTQYKQLMGALEYAVFFQDGHDEKFIQDYKYVEEYKRNAGMFVNMKISNIALVTLNDEKQQVFSKIFLQNMKMQMLSFPDNSKATHLDIQKMKGYHLISNVGKFYEKGFIGDFVVNKIYETESNDELKEQFIADLLNQDYSENFSQKTKNMSMKMTEANNVRKIDLTLQKMSILVQMDVLLHLSNLTQMPQKPLEFSQTQNTNLQKKESPKMDMVISFTDNHFILPNQEYSQCLVTSGNIDMKILMNPQEEIKTVINQQQQDNIQKIIISSEENVIKFRHDHIKMKMDMNLNSFQIYLADFLEIYEGDFHNIEKRQLLMPFDLKTQIDQYTFYGEIEKTQQIEKININKIKADINKIKLKIADRDVEILQNISDFMKVQMGEEKVEETEEIKSQKIIQNEITYQYISFNIIEQVVVTLVHEYERIFVPTFNLKMKQFKFLADIEDTMKVVLAFALQVDYFNSDIFKWEPFLEKTKLRLEQKTEKTEDGVEGSTLILKNINDTNFNINLSPALLKKINFLQKTFDEMKTQSEKQRKEMSSMQQMINLDQLQKDKLIKLTQNDKEIQKTFVSPVKIFNYSGYEVEVIYYQKVIEIDDKNVPKLKNVSNQKLLVKQNQSEPLNLQEQLQDKSMQNQGTKSQFSYKFISLQFNHPNFEMKKISGLNLESNYNQKINLSAKQKNVKNYHILYSSVNKNDLKEIYITSSIKLENTLDKTMKLEILHPLERKEILIQPGEYKFIPFDLISLCVNFYLGGEYYLFKKKKLDFFSLRESLNCIMLYNKSKNKFFALKIFRNQKNHQLTHLMAVPCFSFQNLLPVPIKLKLKNHKESKSINLAINERCFFNDFDISIKVMFQVKIQGYEWTLDETLIENKKPNYNKDLTIQDEYGMTTVFQIFRFRKQKYYYSFAIYSDLMIINETPLEYNVQGSKQNKRSKMKKLGGLNPLKGEEKLFSKEFIFVGGNFHDLQFNLKEDKNFIGESFSNKIPTQGIGSGVIQANLNSVKNNNKFFLEIGYKSKLQVLEEKEYLSCKVIHLTPKTILFNKTKYKIRLLNQSFVRDSVLEPSERQPLFIFDHNKNKDKKLNILIPLENSNFKNMTPIDLNKAGSSLFMLLNEEGNLMVIRVEILIENDYVVVNFLDRTGKEDLIINNDTEFEMVVHQDKKRSLWERRIKSKEKIALGFIDPYSAGTFVFEIMMENGEQFGTFKQSIKSIKNQEHTVTKRNFGELKFMSLISLENESRILIIKRLIKGDDKDINIKQKEANKIDFQNFKIEIQNFGISLVSHFCGIRVESFYLYMNKIMVYAILTETQQEVQVAINYINIDNNYFALSKYPVLLTTEKSLKQMRNSQFFNLHFIQNLNKSKNLMEFELFELEIKPLILTTEQLILNIALKIQENMNEIYEQKNHHQYLDKYFLNEESFTDSLVAFDEQDEWQTIKFKTSNDWIYCKEFRVAQIQLIVTFGFNQLTNNEMFQQQNDHINSNFLVKTLGVTLFSVDESPVTFPNLEMVGIFESFEGFQNIMMTHYKDQFASNAAKLLGNLDIIGNPVSLFSNVTGGFKQFYQKPKEGFVKGPVEGFYGIAKGSSSLVSVTAASAFNAVSKMTNSLASGLTSLSMDDEYLRKRNLLKARKPQNLFEGVGKGFVSVGTGVISGITGVFTKPIDEMNKSGAKGIFKGIFKGIGGLITKPIGGVFDAVSLTADGFKNTVTYFDDKANDKKQRIPRVFYSKQRYFKHYNSQDAVLMKQLKKIESKKFENDIFLDSIKITNQNVKKSFYVVLTRENLIVFNYKMKKLVIYFGINTISKIKCDNPNSIKFEYFAQVKRGQPKLKQLFEIHAKESKIVKLLTSINYARYINYINKVNK